MSEHLWSILAEFTRPCLPEDFEPASNAMQMAVVPLRLPETFLQRLNVALKETVANHSRRAEPSGSTAKIRILSNAIASDAQASSSSWGFFFIETDQLIELYLYQDGQSQTES